jgi:hypothetical protein
MTVTARDAARVQVVGWLVGVFVVAAGCDAKGADGTGSARRPKRFAEALTTWPAPDVEHLADQTAPGYKPKAGEDTFRDILKLRETGDAKAVPVLAKIMLEKGYSGNIYGFAAAQALYCIGTPEAHRLLEKHMLDARYNARLGMMYTYHWDMDPSKRDGFIDRYLLRNLSATLDLHLDARSRVEGSVQKIDFIVTLRNESGKAYQMIEEQVFLGELLYFRSKTGRFARAIQTCVYKPLMPKKLKLRPGQTHTYTINTHVRRAGETDY